MRAAVSGTLHDTSNTSVPFVVVSRFQLLWVFPFSSPSLSLPPAEFSTHSFRIGAATAAHGMGFSDEELQQLGRWDSFSFSLYVHPQLLF